MKNFLRQVGWFLWFKTKETAPFIAAYTVCFYFGEWFALDVIGLYPLPSWVRFVGYPSMGILPILLVACVFLLVYKGVFPWLRDNWRKAGKKIR